MSVSLNQENLAVHIFNSSIKFWGVTRNNKLNHTVVSVANRSKPTKRRMQGVMVDTYMTYSMHPKTSTHVTEREAAHVATFIYKSGSKIDDIIAKYGKGTEILVLEEVRGKYEISILAEFGDKSGRIIKRTKAIKATQGDDTKPTYCPSELNKTKQYLASKNIPNERDTTKPSLLKRFKNLFS